MTTLTIVRHLLECDGCGTIFGNRNGYDSQMEARAMAFAAGWRFPNQVTVKETASSHVSDVCPQCAPAWKAQSRNEKRTHQRMLAVAEWAQLPEVAP